MEGEDQIIILRDIQIAESVVLVEPIRTQHNGALRLLLSNRVVSRLRHTIPILWVTCDRFIQQFVGHRIGGAIIQMGGQLPPQSGKAPFLAGVGEEQRLLLIEEVMRAQQVQINDDLQSRLLAPVQCGIEQIKRLSLPVTNLVPHLLLVDGQPNMIELPPTQLGDAVYICLCEKRAPLSAAALALTEPVGDIGPPGHFECHNCIALLCTNSIGDKEYGIRERATSG